MLIIRNVQMAALSQYMLDLFAEEMVQHVHEEFSEKCATMGETDVRETIQSGIVQAAKYGIVLQRDIGRFIDLMFVFGRDFATDPRIPWASQILNDPDIPDPMTRMQRLGAEARRAEG